MRLKLTLSRASGAGDDIVVTADAAASISEIASTIRRVDPRAGDAPTPTDARALTLRAALPGQAEPLVLPPDAPVGEAWIGSGATVSLADAGVYYAPNDLASAPVVATAEVIGGPDAGREFPLRRGTTVVGRDESCDIVLHDPLVSKRHVRLEAGDGVEVIDLGSANGVVVDGGIVSRFTVRRSETLLIGDTEVRVTVSGLTDVPAAAPTAGPLFFNRSPRVEQRYAGQMFQAPEVPTEKEDPPFPLLAMLTPLLLGGAMFMLTKQPTTLLFVLLSPVMLIGNYITGRSRGKRKLKKAIAVFDKRLEALTEKLAVEREREQALRRAESPTTASALSEAVQRGPLLWTRRPEHWSFLNVQLGIGAMPSPQRDPGERPRRDARGVPGATGCGDRGARARRRRPGARQPVRIGRAGDRRLRRSTSPAPSTRLLVQLTALHSPAELVVASLVSPRWSRELEWLKWMPHTSLAAQPDRRRAPGRQRRRARRSAHERARGRRRAARWRRRERRPSAAERWSRSGPRWSGAPTSASPRPSTRRPRPSLPSSSSSRTTSPIDRARLVQLAERAADAGIFPIWLGDDHREAAGRLPHLPRTRRTR